MNTFRSAAGFTSLCLMLLVWSVVAQAATEFLYVQENQAIVSYSVNNVTAKTVKLGSSPLNPPLSFHYTVEVTHSPTLPYAYVLGHTSATSEYISVFKANAAGLLGKTPIQILAVKPAVQWFYIHPNGMFGYAVFAWKNANNEYVSDIVLFTIDQKTGKLTNTTKPVAGYAPFADRQTLGYGFNTAGSRFYAHQYVYDENGNNFISYSVNPKTGSLSNMTYFWYDGFLTNPGVFASTIGDKLIALAFNKSDGENGINIYQNGPDAQATDPIISCTSSMLALCDDRTIAAFHPSGAYLFVTDYTKNEAPIVYISTVKKELEVSGASIPGVPRILTFSPDGSLVFALVSTATGEQILVYVFNPHTGLLTNRTAVPVPTNSVATMVASK
jgi:hypothetical protein